MQKLTLHDVRVHPGDSAFLLEDGQSAVLIDSGFGFTGEGVADRIDGLLGSRRLDAILLTHSHYDHALGAAHVARRRPEARIVASAYTAKIFAKPGARATMRELDAKFAAACGVADYTDRTDELRVDVTLEDGEELCAGSLRFRAIALPGHTRCSVGYYMPGHGLLICPETLGVFDGEESILPSCLVGYEMTLQSIVRARALAPEVLMLPHYGLLPRERTAWFLTACEQSLRQTAKEICGLLARGESREAAVEFFKQKFYRGRVPDIYPIDAMELNTGITVDLLQRECLQQHCPQPKCVVK